MDVKPKVKAESDPEKRIFVPPFGVFTNSKSMGD